MSRRGEARPRRRRRSRRSKPVVLDRDEPAGTVSGGRTGRNRPGLARNARFATRDGPADAATRTRARPSDGRRLTPALDGEHASAAASPPASQDAAARTGDPCTAANTPPAGHRRAARHTPRTSSAPAAGEHGAMKLRSIENRLGPDPDSARRPRWPSAPAAAFGHLLATLPSAWQRATDRISLLVKRSRRPDSNRGPLHYE